MYDLTTEEGVKAFNNRVPVNSDGTPYDEAEDAWFIKGIGKMMFIIPSDNIFENFDAKFSKFMKSLAPSDSTELTTK